MFLEAQREIYRLMKTDSFLRFSNYYTRDDLFGDPSRIVQPAQNEPPAVANTHDDTKASALGNIFRRQSEETTDIVRQGPGDSGDEARNPPQAVELRLSISSPSEKEIAEDVQAHSA